MKSKSSVELVKIKRLVLGLALIAISISLKAQSLEEVHQKFPNDHAVILNLNKETKIFLKNNVPVAETREETEILVLNEKANGLYNKYKVYHSSFNEVKDIEAYTKVPDGSKYRKIKVTDIKTESARSSSVFYDDMKESVFDFPSLVKGAIASVSYTEFHKDAHFLTPFYFTTYMPIVNARYTITVPSNIELKYILKNDEESKVQVKEEKKGKQTVYEFTSANLRSKDSYENAPPRSHFEPHVIIHLASYQNDNGEKINFLKNPEDLYKWNAGFLKDINTQPSATLKHLVDSLTGKLKTEKEKTKEIYKWVQENIKYVAFEDGLEGFVPRQANDVCNKRYGDCKDMSSLLTAMLQLAGIKAYFTWIGTRDIPYTYTEVPLPITDNHMISTVNIDNQWIFLDGTDPNCIYGTPSKGIQGKQAMVALNQNEFKIVQVPELEAEKNFVVDSTFITISENGIKGNTRVYYNGYFGVDAYNNLHYRDTKDTKDYVKGRISKGSNKFILDDYVINKISNSEKIIGINTTFQVPDYGKKIADEYYINMNLDRFYNTSIIDTAKRKVPVDNDFKFYVKQYTILEIPNGYDINYIPENSSYKNDLFAFNINYTQSGRKIIAAQEFKSDVMLLQPKDFSKWNSAIKELTSQYKKQLVLKKK